MSSRRSRSGGMYTELTSLELARRSDIVIISTPVDAAIQIAQTIGPVMTENQALMDFCSLKEEIVTAMVKGTRRAEVVGTHPLFGPFTRSLVGQNIILTPGRGDKWRCWIDEEFKKMGAATQIMGADVHDRTMAVIQGLTHLLTISTGRTLQKLNMRPEEAMLSATPIFKVSLDFIGRLFAQDLELYSMLVGRNKYVPEMLDTFLGAMEEGRQALLNGAPNEGITFLEEIKKYLGPFCEEGLKQSNQYLSYNRPA